MCQHNTDTVDNTDVYKESTTQTDSVKGIKNERS